GTGAEDPRHSPPRRTQGARHRRQGPRQAARDREGAPRPAPGAPAPGADRGIMGGMSRELAWIGGAVKATVACAGAAVALAWMAAPAEAHVVYVVDRARDQVVPFDTALGTAGEPAPVGNTPTW